MHGTSCLRGLVLLAVFADLGIQGPAAQGRELAVAGFNDAAGVLSDRAVGSPYLIGATVHHQGANEPGWQGPWDRIGGSDEQALVVSDPFLEGDGAVSLWADPVTETRIERAWSESVPKVRVDAYVFTRPAARMEGHVMGPNDGSPVDARTAGGWLIRETGAISLFDAALATYIPTPFSAQPNTWNKFSLFADTRTQAWEFAFNDVKFRLAHPLQFINSLESVSGVNLAAISRIGSFVDYIKVTAIDPTTGDVNGDEVLDVFDIDELTLKVRAGKYDPGYDINGDGGLNDEDRQAWVKAKRRTYFGDANLDGMFNSGDLIAVFQAGRYEDTVPGNALWASGDWDGDGDFSSGDLIVAFQDGGYEQAPPPPPPPPTGTVPEPARGMLRLAAVIVGLWVRHGGRRADRDRPVIGAI